MKTIICTSWGQIPTSHRRAAVLIVIISLYYVSLVIRVFNEISSIGIKILLINLVIRTFLTVHLLHIKSIITSLNLLCLLRNEKLVLRNVICRSYVFYTLLLIDFLASLLYVAYLRTF